jgi:hypothetical protein
VDVGDVGASAQRTADLAGARCDELLEPHASIDCLGDDA